MRRTHQITLMLALGLAACGTGETTTETTDPTTTTTSTTIETTTSTAVEEVAVEEAAVQPPAGNSEVTIEWVEADLSDQAWIDQVTTTDEGFIAYAGDAAWVSSDGVSWSETALGFDGEETGMDGVNRGGPGFVAMGHTHGENESVLTSTDGLNWQTHPIEVDIPPGEFEGFHQVVAFDGGILVQGSFLEGGEEDHHHRSFLALSEDGGPWEVLADEETMFGPGATINEIYSAGSNVIATGFVEGEGFGGEQFWVSSDGRSWDSSLTVLSDFNAYPGVVPWKDGVLSVSNGDAGIRLLTSLDGRDWETLPATDPALDHSEEYNVYANQVAAGPAGVVIVANYSTPQPEPDEFPPVIVEKDGITVTVDMMSGRTTVSDANTGEVLFEPDLENEDQIRIDDDTGVITFLDPDTGDELISFTFEEFEEAQRKAFAEAGIDLEGLEGGESRETLLFSPDGESWVVIELESIAGAEHFPMDMVVGDDEILVIFEEFIAMEVTGSTEEEEDPAFMEGEIVIHLWVGKISD